MPEWKTVPDNRVRREHLEDPDAELAKAVAAAVVREHLSALLSFRLRAGETASEVWRSLGPFAIGYHAARLLDLGRRPADA